MQTSYVHKEMKLENHCIVMGNMKMGFGVGTLFQGDDGLTERLGTGVKASKSPDTKFEFNLTCYRFTED